MKSNILNFPMIPRATVHASLEDARTAMIKAIDRCEKEYGEQVTANTIARRYQIIDDIPSSDDWRSKARSMFCKEKK